MMFWDPLTTVDKVFQAARWSYFLDEMELLTRPWVHRQTQRTQAFEQYNGLVWEHMFVLGFLVFAMNDRLPLDAVRYDV